MKARAGRERKRRLSIEEVANKPSPRQPVPALLDLHAHYSLPPWPRLQQAKTNTKRSRESVRKQASWRERGEGWGVGVEGGGGVES